MRRLGRRGMRRCMMRAREPVDEVIGRPWARKLHMALLHDGGGGRELVLVALHAFAINKVGDIEQHFAVIEQTAAHFFIERHEEPVHLEADGTGACLALTLARRGLPQVGEVFPANLLSSGVIAKLLGATVVDKDFQVHLGFTAEFLNVGEELALVGPDGFAEAFIVTEDSPEAEGQHRRLTEAVGDDAGMIHACLLAKFFCWIVFADDDGEIACRIEENLIAADAGNRFQWDWFTMTG